MDMKLLEKRLLTRDSVLASSSVSKCALRLQQFLVALQANDQSDSDTEQAKGALIRELALYKLEIGQAVEGALMCEREMDESRAIEKSIEEEIHAAELDINNLTQELNEQKRIRKHKEECELLAKLVNTLPPKSAVMKDIVKAEDALNKLREQSQSAEYRVSMRKKQFQVLLQSIFDMKQNIAEDSEQQELIAGVEAAAAPEEEEATPAPDSDAEENDEEEGGRRGRNEDEGPAKKKTRVADDGENVEDDEGPAAAEGASEEASAKGSAEPEEVETPAADAEGMSTATEKMEVEGEAP